MRALPELEMLGGDVAAAVRVRRDAYSARAGTEKILRSLHAYSLKPGMTFDGPCLIEEKSATTVVDVGARVKSTVTALWISPLVARSE